MKPQRRRRRLAALMIMGTLVIACGAAAAVKWKRASTPAIASPDHWESPHVWWQEGRCNECHQPEKSGEIVHETGISRQPRSHHDPFWRETHGRSELSSEARCFICHTVDTCKTCHNHPPVTHTRDFLQPGGDSTAALRHITLARARPSSCMVCHQDFVSSCSKCHGSNEVYDWYEQGSSDLERWPSLLKSLQSYAAKREAAP